MWNPPDKVAGGWYCQVGWGPLPEEKEQHLDAAMLAGWVDDLINVHGADIANWPNIGCGAKFAPSPMVAELKLGPNGWASSWRTSFQKSWAQ